MTRKILIAGMVLLGPSDTFTQSLPPMPNITINAARIQSSLVFRTTQFKGNNCATVEGCVGGPGKRSLMRFDVQTPNIGTADLYLGNPANNPAFVFSPCHGHYHLEGYAFYDLLNPNGTPVVVNGRVIVGHKQAFCLLDYVKVDPAAGPAKYTCSNQGISVGWSDVYGSNLDCQWIDVTGVPGGNYFLRVTINGGPSGTHVFAESDYSDNVAVVPVTIPQRIR
jgi:lysyl oxidase